MFKYFDAHAHIHDEAYADDRADIISSMQKAGIGAITVGTTLETSREAVTLAEKNENIWATIGIHPTDSLEKFEEGEFSRIVSSPKVVGIGECGIDYFRSEDIALDRSRQMPLFESQIDFAAKHGKSLMVHGRPSRGTLDAYEDILSAVESKSSGPGALRGNIHFFAGTVPVARRFLDLGFSLSFTGVVTFARDYDEVVRFVPEDMILSETDCPYVSPEPHRGKRNDPSKITVIAEYLAKIRGEKPEVFVPKLALNAMRVFAVAPR